MPSEHDVLDALQRLRLDADEVAASAHVAGIRLAMHSELGRRRRAGVLHRVRATLTAPRLAYPGIGIALAGVALLVAGWSSPAGSPLHDVQLAREWVQRSLPGTDQSALLLSWAEGDLGNARAGINRQASVAEATTLLDECRDYLAASPATLGRWQRDEAELVAIAGAAAPGAASAPAQDTNGDDSASAGSSGGPPNTSDGSHDGAAAPSASSGGGENETPSTSDGSHHGSTSSSGPGSSSGEPPTTTAPSPMPGGGDGVSSGGPGPSGGGSNGSDGGSTGGSPGGTGSSSGDGSGTGSDH